MPIYSDAEEEQVVASDVETNLGRYSPLISSASEQDFIENLSDSGSMIREQVI
jgi:hypothetical protein